MYMKGKPSFPLEFKYFKSILSPFPSAYRTVQLLPYNRYQACSSMRGFEVIGVIGTADWGSEEEVVMTTDVSYWYGFAGSVPIVPCNFRSTISISHVPFM